MTTTDPAVRILRSDDPEAVRLLAAGAQVQGESWGARLTVTPAVLATCRAAVDAARGAGWTVRALVPQESAVLVELDACAARTTSARPVLLGEGCTTSAGPAR